MPGFVFTYCIRQLRLNFNVPIPKGIRVATENTLLLYYLVCACQLFDQYSKYIPLEYNMQVLLGIRVTASKTWPRQCSLWSGHFGLKLFVQQPFSKQVHCGKYSCHHLPTTYQPPTNPPTDHLPTTYPPPTDHLQTTYQPPTDHLPTTYQPPTDTVVQFHFDDYVCRFGGWRLQSRQSEQWWRPGCQRRVSRHVLWD